MLTQRFVPAPLTSRHVLRFSCLSAIVQFGVFVRHSAGPMSAAELVTVANTIKGWWADNATKALAPDEATLIDIVSTDESDQHGARTVTASGVVGTSASALVAPTVAAVASLHTAQRGRSYRGRVFWPFPTVAQLTSPGLLSQGSVDAIAGQFEVLRLALNAGGTHALAVVSRYTGYVTDESNPARPKVRAAARPGNAVITDVTSISVDARLRTQRKRAVGVGV